MNSIRQSNAWRINVACSMSINTLLVAGNWKTALQKLRPEHIIGYGDVQIKSEKE